MDGRVCAEGGGARARSLAGNLSGYGRPERRFHQRAERLLENVEDHGAFQRYERAIPKEERGEALVRMGRAARETNQNDANKYYWRALYAAPESEEIAIELDTALIETGNQEKRLELLSFRAERATQEKKRCALKVARIRLLVTLGQKETALRELHPVLERWPEEEGVRTLAAELIAPKAVPEAGGMGVEARAPEAKSVADEDQTVPTLLPVFSDPPPGIVTRGTAGWDEAYAAFCHSPAEFSVLDALVRHAKSVAHTRAIEHVRAAIHGEPTTIPNLRAQQYAANALELTCPSTPALEMLETIWERAGRTLQKKPGFQAAGKEPIDPNVQSERGKIYQGVLNALSAPKVQMFGEHVQGGPLVHLVIRIPPLVVIRLDSGLAEDRLMAKGVAMALPRHVLAMGLAPEYWNVVTDCIVLAFSDSKKWQEANLARRTFANDSCNLSQGLQRKLRELLPSIGDGFARSSDYAAACCERACLFVNGDVRAAANERRLLLGAPASTEEMSIYTWRELVGRDELLQEVLKFAVSFPYAEARWGMMGSP